MADLRINSSDDDNTPLIWDNIDKPNNNTLDMILNLDSEIVETPIREISMCRICFEDDFPNSMINPCRCKGDQQWVHVECLDQWRATAQNSEAFDRCFTCQYKYRMEYQPPQLSCLGRFNQALAQHICFLCPLILLAILLGGLGIRTLDVEQKIYYFFRDKIVHESPDQNGNYNKSNEYFYYYVFTSYLYLTIIILGMIINVLRMKNRLLYIKYLLGYDWFCGVIRIFSVILLTLLTFYLNIYLGCVIMTLEIQTMIQVHYLFLHYRYKASRNRIMPYNEKYDNEV